MGRITLEGMQFKSHIGVYAFEQQYGNNFEVDVVVESNFIDGATDDITKTVNYDIIYSVVKNVMSNRYNLIEYAAKLMIDDLSVHLTSITYIKIRITKLHPPLGTEVKKVSAELEWHKG